MSIIEDIQQIISLKDFLLVGSLAALGFQTWYSNRRLHLDQRAILFLLLLWPITIPVMLGALFLGFGLHLLLSWRSR